MGFKATRFETALNDEQIMEIAGELGALLEQPGWATFLELLKGAQSQAREAGFGDVRENFDTWQGYVQGLGAAAAILPAILGRAKEVSRKDEAVGKLRRLRTIDGGDMSGF